MDEWMNNNNYVYVAVSLRSLSFYYYIKLTWLRLLFRQLYVFHVAWMMSANSVFFTFSPFSFPFNFIQLWKLTLFYNISTANLNVKNGVEKCTICTILTLTRVEKKDTCARVNVVKSRMNQSITKAIIILVGCHCGLYYYDLVFSAFTNIVKSSLIGNSYHIKYIVKSVRRHFYFYICI